MEAVLAAAAAASEDTLTRARRNVDTRRTSTTLVALAQAVTDTDEAIKLACEAMALAIGQGDVADPLGARTAADLLLALDDARYVFDSLRNLKRLPRALTITLVSVSIDLERSDDANRALAGIDGPTASLRTTGRTPVPEARLRPLTTSSTTTTRSSPCGMDRPS